MITKKINKVKNLKNEKWLNWQADYYVSNKGRAKRIDANGNETLLQPSERLKGKNPHLFLNLKSAGLG